MISLAKLLRIGCGDNSCQWGVPGGMGTNGGCRCDKRLEYVATAGADIAKRQSRRQGIFALRVLAESPDGAAGLNALVDAVLARNLAERLASPSPGVVAVVERDLRYPLELRPLANMPPHAFVPHTFIAGTAAPDICGACGWYFHVDIPGRPSAHHEPMFAAESERLMAAWHPKVGP